MKADKQKITRLIKTARGQLDGILRMVEEDRYCIDISQQLMATADSFPALSGTAGCNSFTDHCC